MSHTSKRFELWRNIGMALSTWSAVEIILSDLFANMVEMKNGNKAHALFATIISFETRLQVLDRLMTYEGVDPVEMEMWARMSARLSRYYKKRHELAHFGIGRD